MGMRKTAIVAMIAFAVVGGPVLQRAALAQAPMAGPMASSLSPDQKQELVKKLETAKAHDKVARAGWSQEPITQAGYDKKIDEIKALEKKLQTGEDFPLSDVDKAVASPHSAPY